VTADQLLGELAKLVAAEVVRELRSGPSDLVPQAASPLGKRRHCAAVRARVARGDSGACIVGRTHYLAPAALHEELRAISRPAKRKSAPKLAAFQRSTGDDLAALRAELGLERAARKGAA
jgi:hypothetical protein